MLNPKYMPVATIAALKEELAAQGVDGQYLRKLRTLMFEDASNDTYVSYYIADDVRAEYYEDKAEAKVMQTILDILREAYPNAEKVLIDVSW